LQRVTALGSDSAVVEFGNLCDAEDEAEFRTCPLVWLHRIVDRGARSTVDFTSAQVTALRALVLFGRDVNAVLPTGAGKSMLYQIPPLMQNGVAVVVSPLLALMADQAACFANSEIRAVRIGSDLSNRLQRQALLDIPEGKASLLFVPLGVWYHLAAKNLRFCGARCGNFVIRAVLNSSLWTKRTAW
jgi:hypothetical protein